MGLTHVLTFFHWNQSSFFVNSQRDLNSDPLCYPFFPNCDLFRALIPEAGWQLILFFYLLLSIITTLFFLKQRFIKKAFFFLAITTLFKLTLHLSNYNFTDDHHLMVHLVSFLYLFVPNKKINILFLIPAFYMAAGFSKINPDWLTGAISINTPWLHGNVLLFSLAYVILLESFLVLGLLSAWSWLRWITLSQLLLMHGYSWFTFGFYYPMIMFCLLSFFFLDDFFHQNPVPSSESFPGRKKTISVCIVLFVFAFLQTLPHILVKEPSLSGIARLSSLNLWSSQPHCKVLMVTHSQNLSVHLMEPVKDLGKRLDCDPLVFLNQAYQLCRKNKKSGEFDRLSLSIMSKPITQQRFQKILDLDDVCRFKNPLWAELYHKENF